MFPGLRSRVKAVLFQCGVGVAASMVIKVICSFSALDGRFAGFCKRLEKSCESLKLSVVVEMRPVRELKGKMVFAVVEPAELYLLAI